MNSQLKAIEYYLPDRVLTNAELQQEFPEWPAEKVEEKVGIKQRHIVSEYETALDLAYEASVKVLNNIDKNTIDFILLCTQSPDYFLPTSACILQEKLGLRKDIGALDFNLGCSGFVYGLSLAKGLIKADIARNVLLVTAETYSKHMSKNDKANRSIFGDAAAASIVSASDSEKILNFDLGTDGGGKDNLIVRGGGLRNRTSAPNESGIENPADAEDSDKLFMNGPEIFNFTIENVPGVFNNVLSKNSLMLNEIDYVIFHQANKYMLTYLQKKIGIPKDKFYNNMLNTGNTVSSTIPIAIKECLDNGTIKSGDRVLLLGFGVGYSWGGTIIEI